MSCRSGGEPGGLLMGRTRCTGEWVRRCEYAVIQILIMTTMSCTHVRTGQLLPGVFPSFSCYFYTVVIVERQAEVKL